MPFIEVTQNGRVVMRHPIDEARARSGCKVRLGHLGKVQLQPDQPTQVGSYLVRLSADPANGDVPPAARQDARPAVRRGEGANPAAAREAVTETTPPHGAPRPSEAPNGRAGEIEGYRIEGELGHGGMGVVWRAVQESTQRPVALKLMSDRTFFSEQARVRFQREVELAARLDHPHIARVYDSGLAKGMHYYAMELVQGVNLDHFVRQRALPPEEVLALMLPACRAVQHAHQRGVIHRDLKPSNILVTEEGKPFVLDFGLARSILEEDKGLTVSAEDTAVGTPAYMSPEQAAGRVKEIDTRSDVYSLGIILYELLVGQPPHSLEGSRLEMIRRRAEEEVRRPRLLRGEINPELEALLLKALARVPAERYASAGELADDLENYLKGEPLAARPATTLYFLRKRLRKHRLPAAAVLLVAALLLGTGLWSYLRVSDARDKAEGAAVQERAAREALQAQQTELIAAKDQAQDASERWRRALYVTQLTLADTKYNAAQAHHVRPLLRQCPADLRHWEWRRLWRVSDHSQTVLRLRESYPTAFAFAPDGQRMALATRDGRLLLNDSADQQTLWEVQAHPRWITEVSWHPEGRLLATAGTDGLVKLWDPQSGELLRTLEGHQTTAESGGDVWRAVFSPDGALLATCSNDHTVRLWEVAGGQPLHVLHGHTSAVYAVAFSPDGRRLVSGSVDRSLRLWDVATGAALARQTIDPRHLHVAGLCFTPDGTQLVAKLDKAVALFDAATLERRWLAEHPDILGTSLQLSPDGRQIALSGKNVLLFDLAGGQLQAIRRGQESDVTRVAYSADGRDLYSASRDGSLRRWPGQPPADESSYAYQGTGDHFTAYDPIHHRLALGLADGSVHLYDLATGAYRTVAGRHTQSVLELSFYAGGTRLATAGEDEVVRLWNVEDGQPLGVLEGHASYVHAVAVSPDERLMATATFDHIIRIWDPQRREVVRIIPGEEVAEALQFTPDGRYLLAADGWRLNGVRLWDLQTFQPVWYAAEHQLRLTTVTLSPDGRRLATASFDGNVHLRDLKDGKLLATLKGHQATVQSAQFSHDGRRLVTASDDQTIKIWDAGDGTELLTLRGHQGPVRSAYFSADDRTIISTSLDQTIRLWLTADPGEAGTTVAAR